MKTLSVSKARDVLDKLVGEVAADHEPVFIRGKNGSAVLLDQREWRAIQETLYLLSVPGMRESIREGLQTPLDQCSEEPTW